MRRRLIPLLFVLGSGWLGALIFGGVLREVLIVPVLYAYWYARLLLESLPQWAVWGGFVALTLWLVMSAWWRLLADSTTSRSADAETEMGDVEALAERLQLAVRGGYFHRRLRKRLRGLVGDVVAARERRSPNRVKDELNDRPDGLPRAVRPLFEREPPRPRFGFRLLRRHDVDEFATAIDWLDRATAGLHMNERDDDDRHGD